MNLTFIRIKGLVRALQSIDANLSRIADCYEADLADRNIYVKPPKTDTSGPAPTVGYTDEEVDWAKEEIDYIRREEERKTAEEA